MIIIVSDFFIYKPLKRAAMKIFAQILFYIGIIIKGSWRIFRDYVFPIVHFINALKEIIESTEKGTGEIEPDESYFAKILRSTEAEIKILFKFFRKALFALLPDMWPANTSNINLIKKLVEHLRSLSKYQRAALLFKLASLMLIYWYDNKDFEQKQADMLVQMAYNYTEKNS